MSRCKFCNVKIPHIRFLRSIYTDFCSEECHHYYELFESFILNEPFELNEGRVDDTFIETLLIKSEKQKLGLLTTKDLEDLKDVLNLCVESQFKKAVRKKKQR